jgi:hypothetical protein
LEGYFPFFESETEGAYFLFSLLEVEEDLVAVLVVLLDLPELVGEVLVLGQQGLAPQGQLVVLPLHAADLGLDDVQIVL